MRIDGLNPQIQQLPEDEQKPAAPSSYSSQSIGDSIENFQGPTSPFSSDPSLGGDKANLINELKQKQAEQAKLEQEQAQAAEKTQDAKTQANTMQDLGALASLGIVGLSGGLGFLVGPLLGSFAGLGDLGLMGNALGAVGGMLGAEFGQIVEDPGQWLQGAFTNPIGTAGNMIQSVGTQVTDAAKGAATLATDVGDAVSHAAGDVANAVGNAASSVGNAISNAFGF